MKKLVVMMAAVSAIPAIIGASDASAQSWGRRGALAKRWWRQGGRVMKNCLSGLGSALFLSLMLAAPANADACSYRMGPFVTQDAAQAAAQQARYLGFEASGVWGQGGLYSDWSNRRYFFNVFYEC